MQGKYGFIQGGIMEYITSGIIYYLEYFKEYKGIRNLTANLKWIKKTLDTELPHAADKEIHILGMTHGAKNMSPDSKKSAIKSQKLIVKTLEEIQPDIVGVEGFCGEEYTPEKLIKEVSERLTMVNPGVKTSDAQDIIENILNDPTNSWVTNFYKMHPGTKFYGIESQDLIKISDAISISFDLKKQSQDSMYKGKIKIEEIYREINRLRGLFMIAKLTRAIRKTKAVKAAVPVGAAHMLEMNQLCHHLGAENWYFYDASQLTKPLFEFTEIES